MHRGGLPPEEPEGVKELANAKAESAGGWEGGRDMYLQGARGSVIGHYLCGKRSSR
jgi:hypothetical protein